jgi:hypothetical protein
MIVIKYTHKPLWSFKHQPMLECASKRRYDFVVDKFGRVPALTAVRCVRHSLISDAKGPGGTRQDKATINHRPWFTRFQSLWCTFRVPTCIANQIPPPPKFGPGNCSDNERASIPQYEHCISEHWHQLELFKYPARTAQWTHSVSVTKPKS